MATDKYFADVNGETIELVAPHGMDNRQFAINFPGVQGRRYDGFSMLVGYEATGAGRISQRRRLPVTRIINFKSNPSRHECDARCMNASGRTMNCECACGGKNHGRGTFNCTSEAA